MYNFKELRLDPKILMGVDAAGYQKPFPIQERTIGPLLAGVDVIGQAKTGTGKTAAYGLPLLQAINTQSNRVQALVLSPTRELALQITAEIKKLGMYTGIETLTIYGGQSINIQFKALSRRGAYAVVGTPGRVIDHIKRGTLDLDSVKYVVLDEADTMLEMGFVDDVEFILDSIPGERQLSLFSATMPQRIIELSEKYMQNPERILIDSDEPSVDTLDQYYAVVERGAKLSNLIQILTREKPSSSMIFCRTKYGANRLARELEGRRLNAVPLHGDLSQCQREHSMSLFRSGRADILVATDVASRGIDIRQVDCVINYEVPQDPLLYFHRVGRTARAGGAGKSYTLVSYEEFSDFARIRNLTKATIKPLRPEDERHVFYVSHNAPKRAWRGSKFRSRSRGQELGWSRHRRMMLSQNAF
ncbi:MAG: DEAD/DEAH box helicase [Candidatus Bathyarchaeia archaeon]